MHTDPSRSKDPCTERCPLLIRETLDVISSKWTVPIVLVLHEARASLRYAELRRRVGPITPKELAKNLRQLEDAGLLHRRVHPTVPPSVEYSLTELGETLYPALEGLADWALAFGPAVARNRAARTARTESVAS